VDDAGRLRGLVQAFLIVAAGETVLVDPDLRADQIHDLFSTFSNWVLATKPTQH
jgi:hypothetical protein